MISLEKKDNNFELLEWGKNVFNFRHRRNRVYIGREIFTRCRVFGKKRILNGVCITIRSKKLGKVAASMVLRRKTHRVIFFVDFPLYLAGAYNFEVKSFSYSRRIVSSRLLYSRFKT